MKPFGICSKDVSRFSSHIVVGIVCSAFTAILVLKSHVFTAAIYRPQGNDKYVDNVVAKPETESLRNIEVPVLHKQESKVNIKRKLENALVMEYDEDVRRSFEELLRREATATDPDVIKLIRDIMDPPSSHGMVKLARKVAETPQSKEVTAFFPGKKGFFIECGALDGERSSNTLPLEKQHQWTGVLIEMDPYFYTQIRGKSRKAYSINACLSPTNRPTQLPFAESSFGLGKIAKAKTNRSMVPCFPLESILLALNRTHVDYFSLDVEGAELDVLKTIPFDKITFDMLSVEYIHGEGESAYRDFMDSKGYKVLKKINMADPKIHLFVKDLIFVPK